MCENDVSSLYSGIVWCKHTPLPLGNRTEAEAEAKTFFDWFVRAPRE